MVPQRYDLACPTQYSKVSWCEEDPRQVGTFLSGSLKIRATTSIISSIYSPIVKFQVVPAHNADNFTLIFSVSLQNL